MAQVFVPQSDSQDSRVITSLNWRGPLFVKHTGSSVSLWTGIGFFVIAAALIDFQRQGGLISAILFVVIGVIVLMRRNREAPIVDFEVSTEGVHVGEKLYPASNIQSFWIHYEPEYGITELSLDLKQWHTAYVKIPIGDLNPVQIRDILVQSIPEEEHSETFFDVILRLIGL